MISAQLPDKWGSRIRELREQRGMKLIDLAKRSGLSHATLSKIERNISKKTQHTTFAGLASGLNMTVDMLVKELGGKAPVARQESPEEILERLRVSISSTVPIYEDFPLDPGIPVEPIDYVPVVKNRAKGRNLEGYIARGDCLNPRINDGDIIIVDRDGEIDNGDIVASLVNGELYLARLRKIDGESYLENNTGRIKLEQDTIARPVIEVRRRLK